MLAVLLAAWVGDVLAPIGVVFAAGVTAYGLWKGLQRTKSGKIDTTEAADLWKEASGMRVALAEQITALQGEIRELKLEETAIREDNQQLRAENIKWRKRVEILEATVTGLHARISHLEKANGTG